MNAKLWKSGVMVNRDVKETLDNTTIIIKLRNTARVLNVVLRKIGASFLEHMVNKWPKIFTKV